MKDAPVDRIPLTRERIIDAAIELIERDGADTVSMRRVAAELGAGVMSLYNHVPNKAALLDAIAERVLAGIEFADDPAADWTDRVRAQLRAFHQVAQHYPRSVMVGVTRPLGSRAGLRPVEHALATLRDAGFEGEVAVRIVRVCVAFTTGMLVREVAIPADEVKAAGSRYQELAPELDPQEYPHIASLGTFLLEFDHDADFEFGMEMLISAIAAMRDRAVMSDDTPVACTLTADQFGDRQAEWGAVIGRHLRRRELTATGLRLEFDGEPAMTHQLLDLVAAERDCCAWADWSLSSAAGGAVIEVTAATETGRATLAELFRDL